MEIPNYKIALIVGAGEGLSASLARLLAKQGIRVALAARQIEKLGALCQETGARAVACDATEPDEVERLFGMVEREIGVPDLVVYNASGRARGVFTDLVPADVTQAIAVSAFGRSGLLQSPLALVPVSFSASAINSPNHSMNALSRRDRCRRCGYTADTSIGAARWPGITSTSAPLSSRCMTSNRGIWISPIPAMQLAL